jgi:hypothetical protein
VAGPFVRLFSACDRLERWWTGLLSGPAEAREGELSTPKSREAA